MKDLLLLHGAIGAQDQMKPLGDLLADDFNIHSLSFSGHGGQPMPAAFSISQFAEDVVSYLTQNNLSSVSVFGYSMGGYVALYLAKHYPQYISRITTLATKFHWDEPTAQKETAMLHADTIEQKVPKFAAALGQRHAPNDWKAVLSATAVMLQEMGRNNPLKLEDYKDIANPVLVLLGDRDKMITLEETIAVYKALPNAQMGMLPNTGHPIEAVNASALAFMLRQFMNA